ncbi:MAG: adenylosuccinate synthase [Deltaproteobacteria bacterium]|nr:adenylosuccinate synthase [Deltaproteobacteria bacterium]
MASLVIIGAQWGDEGKGKVVDLLAQRARMVVRYQGGNNAGHTLVVEGQKTILHLVPSGILQADTRNVIAQGVVVDPAVLVRELDALAARGLHVGPEQLVISARAAVIMPYHCAIDAGRESRLGAGRIGTTGRGIGPAYEDVAARRAVRVGDLLDRARLDARLDRVLDERNATLTWLGSEPIAREAMVTELLRLGERLRPLVTDAECLVRDAVEADVDVLFEGAQGVLLDVLHGTFPYVTSSHTVSGAVATSVGVPPWRVDHVLGIVKAYTSRVGEGPFPTELTDALGDRLREVGQEFGSTTGRPRRCGWLDLAALRYAHRINGFTGLAVTKLDVLSGLETLKVCVGYRVDGRVVDALPADEGVLARAEPVYAELPGWQGDLSAVESLEALPREARGYLDFIERELGVPVALVGVGPGRRQTLELRDPWTD